LENLTKALTFIANQGITLVNIGADDINGGSTYTVFFCCCLLLLLMLSEDDAGVL
jgi:hypothetical protein